MGNGRKVLITNVWPANIGDEAQVDSLITHIKKYDVNADICLLFVNNHSFNIFSSAKKEPFVTEELLAKHFILRDKLYHNLRKKIKFQDYDLFIEAPHGPDIGDLYPTMMNYGISIGRLAKTLGTPIQFSSSSYGPFLKHFPYRKKVLNYASSIIVREPISYSFLINYIPSLKNKIHLGIDWVFAINECDFVSKYNDTFIREEMIIKSAEYIGATINPVPIRRLVDGKKVEINPSSLKDIAVFFDNIIEKTRMKVALFSHIYNFDFTFLKAITNLMKFKNDVHIVDSNLRWAEIIGLMKHLKFFISFRYHPTIFAIKAKIPFVCVMNQHKTEGMMKMLRLDQFVIYEDEGINKIYNLFCNGWEKRKKIVELINRSNKIIKEKVVVLQHTLNDYITI